MVLNLNSTRQRWFSYRSSVKLALTPLQAVPVRMLSRVDCTVSPVAFLPDEIEEQFNRVFLLLEVMNLELASGSDASPAPHKTGLSEEGRFDRHGIEARHVFFSIRAFDIEVIGLGDHGERIAQSGPCVQRQL